MAKSTHELLGIAVEAQANATEELEMTMKLLAAIKSGEIDIDRVTVRPDGWSVAPAPPENPDGGETVPAVAGKVGTGEA